MKVLMFSPGFPAEMPQFTRGLAEVGAAVFGIGDQPAEALPDLAQASLEGYQQVSSLWDEDRLIAEILPLHHKVGFDLVECLWEPGMLVAARLREELGIPGMSVADTQLYRDKELMKQALDQAGIRTPRHFRARTASECRDAAERIGFPIIIKPIAGAGSADTHRVNSASELEAVLPRLHHVEELSVEEFIDGEEFTFDTISIEGEIAYFNIAWYRPRPLLARTQEWVSPQTISLQDPWVPELESGREMGRAVISALGFRTGFTHMEWFLKESGEAVFGEIGARPPGARSVDIMAAASNLDIFRGWAEAVCHHSFTVPMERRYNAAVVFKRAQGEGRISRIEGLERLLFRYGSHITSLDLLPPGASRRNWRQTLLSDGSIVLRHPHLPTLLEMADAFGTDLQIYAE